MFECLFSPYCLPQLHPVLFKELLRFLDGNAALLGFEEFLEAGEFQFLLLHPLKFQDLLGGALLERRFVESLAGVREERFNFLRGFLGSGLHNGLEDGTDDAGDLKLAFSFRLRFGRERRYRKGGGPCSLVNSIGSSFLESPCGTVGTGPQDHRIDERPYPKALEGFLEPCQGLSIVGIGSHEVEEGVLLLPGQFPHQVRKVFLVWIAGDGVGEGALDT